ncbi:hypothetical protein [Mycolicibacterium sp. CBMA 311]|uniref:hypothetical protein n=2 Tax=unclassified Mycolicibacterium TaxID=2636767 RepID=UPI0035CD048C
MGRQRGESMMWPAVRSEIRWAFTPPRSWLLGVMANVVLALVWLVAQPLTSNGRHHQDWVILVGTYFSSFVLADTTTTNVLGADHHRLQQGMLDSMAPWRLLLSKNLALLILIGFPTLAVAAALTLWHETPTRLGVTIPNVAVPIVSWLGVGNVVSVLLPVAEIRLVQRWQHRHDRRRIGIWLLSLALPYALYFIADPVGGVEHRELWRKLPTAVAHVFGPVLGRDTKSFVHLGIAVAVWIAGTVFADWWVRRRGVQFR